MNEMTDPLRVHLARALDWQEARVGFDKALTGIPADRQGALAPGFEHSPWQLLEHMRLAQKDLLDFCANAGYVHELTWPEDYWPREAGPPGTSAWDASVAEFKSDLGKLIALTKEPGVDLYATVPTGKDNQTYLRAILLVIDHNAYHLGQLVAVRRALGCWD